jgi:hypothetical protein
MATQHQAEYWARKINAEWRKSVEGVIRVGVTLIEAKKKCKHGEFLRMFRGNESVVCDPVPFGDKTAERLMLVASHEVLSNGAHAHHLPQSWGTLYELTKLDNEQIIAGIKAGEITPDMTRSEASALRADPVERPSIPPHEEMASAVKNAVTKFVGRLATAEEFAYVRSRIESLLTFLEKQESENGIGRTWEKGSGSRSR